MSKIWVIFALLFIKTALADGINEPFIKDIQNQCVNKVCNLKLDGRAFADAATSHLIPQKNKLDLSISQKKYSTLFWSIEESCPLTEVLSQSGLSDTTWRRFYKNCTFAVDTISLTPRTYLPEFKWTDRFSPAAQLWDWLLKQGDNSVTPLTFFLEAVKYANGNIMEALIAASDVLKIGNKNLGERNHYLQTKKLIDLRGDRSLLLTVNPPELSEHYVLTPVADNFSAWYYFFEAMAFTYHSGPTATEVIVDTKNELCGDTPLKCAKGANIGRQGVYAGAKLTENLLKENLKSEDLSQTSYLKIDFHPENEPSLHLKPRFYY